MVFDLFNTGGGNDGAAAREDAVDCLFFSAARLGVGTHAALADDEFDAGFFDEFLFEKFHAHGSRRTNRGYLPAAFDIFGGNHDRTGVQNGLAVQVNGKFAAELNEAVVRLIAGGNECAVQVDDVADLNLFEIFVADRRVQDMVFHSTTPLCERNS